MRYPKDQKDITRMRLIELGGSHAKQHGFNESGVAALAAAAGVTTGALYKHFSDKTDLFVALVSAELERTAEMYGAADPDDSADATKLLAKYLSLKHVIHPGQGCPLPSLTPEIARAEKPVRSAYQTGLLNVHRQLQNLRLTEEEAWALIAQNVGAVMLARALSDRKLQQDILSAVRSAGEKLLASEKSRTVASKP